MKVSQNRARFDCPKGAEQLWCPGCPGALGVAAIPGAAGGGRGKEMSQQEWKSHD